MPPVRTLRRCASMEDHGRGARSVKGSGHLGGTGMDTRSTSTFVAFTIALVPVVLTLPDAANAVVPWCFGKRATIVGMQRADVIVGA